MRRPYVVGIAGEVGAGEKAFARGEDFFGGRVVGQSVECGGGLLRDARVLGCECLCGVRLGGEGWVVCGRGEREVKFCRAAAEKACGVEVKRGVLADFVGRRLRGVDVGCWGLRFGRGAVGDGLVEAGKFVERPLPAVAFVRRKGLEEAERGAVGGETEVAVVGGDVGEARGVGEEARDLYVRVFAGAEAAEEFEDGLLVVEDAGVGLLG